MASSRCPPSPLLVRLRESIPRAHMKLEKYFQSRASGGGECTVQPVGPSAPNSFEVNFLERAAKERVLKKREHATVIDDKSVAIFLETKSLTQPAETPSPRPPSSAQPAETPSPRPSSLTQPAETPSPRPSSSAQPAETPSPRPSSSAQPAETPSPRPPSLTESRNEALSDETHPSRGPVFNSVDSIVQKVFLAVTAKLNCELLSKEQRARITTVCPRVKGLEGTDGIEKVCGNLEDIKKIHDFLSGQLLQSEQVQTCPPQKYRPFDVEREPPVTKSCYQVPVLLLEYFRHVNPNKIESIEKDFGVNIEIRVNSPPMASVGFTSSQWGNLEKASDSFVKAFQECTQSVKQDSVSFEDHQRTKEVRQELSRCFPKLLIRDLGGTLTLLGSQADIAAAREKVSQTLVKTPVKITASGYATGIEVDSTRFKLLEPELLQKISEIEKKYNTCGKVQERGQKTCILFVPEDREVDLSVHSYTGFTEAFQQATCQLRTEALLLKQFGKEKAQLQKTKYVDDLKKKHPNVHFVVSQESLTLTGLPSRLEQARRSVFKTVGLSPPSGEKLRVDHETPMDIDRDDSAFEGSTTSSVAEQVNENEDICVICMDTIGDKHVLPKCKHEFCTPCIRKAMLLKPVCPVCQTSYGVQKGNQPEGTMSHTLLRKSLPGYEGCGTIVIHYDIKDGIQTKEHPNPGRPYSGTYRKAYLPDNNEGRKVLDLLTKAFHHRLIFTVGSSRTTGVSDVITWNDIHHKTAPFGGPEK